MARDQSASEGLPRARRRTTVGAGASVGRLTGGESAKRTEASRREGRTRRSREPSSQCSSRERKVRRPESSAPPGSLRPTAAEAGAPLRCSFSPTVFPPARIRSPSSDSHLVAPLRTTVTVRSAVLMVRTLTRRCRNRGPRLGCSRLHPTLCEAAAQGVSPGPLLPPGGDSARLLETHAGSDRRSEQVRRSSRPRPGDGRRGTGQGQPSRGRAAQETRQCTH